jgi:hypothetical protein
VDPGAPLPSDPEEPDELLPVPVLLPEPLVPLLICAMQRSRADPVMASHCSLVMVLLPLAELPLPMAPLLLPLPELPLPMELPPEPLLPVALLPVPGVPVMGAPVWATAKVIAVHPIAAAMSADLILNM